MTTSSFYLFIGFFIGFPVGTMVGAIIGLMLRRKPIVEHWHPTTQIDWNAVYGWREEEDEVFFKIDHSPSPYWKNAHEKDPLDGTRTSG